MSESLWFDRTDSAALIGVSARHFDEAVRPKLAADAVRGDRRSLRFHGPAVVAAWVAIKAERAKPAPTDADPLLADGDSPGLERYRNAKADLAEMERDRQRRRIVNVEEIEPALMQLAGVMRNASENLARQFGNDAAGIVNEAVDEWGVGVAKLFAAAESGGAGDEGAAAPVDAAVR
jgi:hypothetical protein